MATLMGEKSYQSRQGRLADLLKKSGLDALILNAGPTLTYLTGLEFHLSERPILGFFMPGRQPVLVLPQLEAGKLTAISSAIVPQTYGENPTSWPSVIASAITMAGIDRAKAGVEPQRFRFLEYQLLHEASPGLQVSSAESIVAALRMYKDEQEIAFMRKAVQITQTALQAVLPLIRLGKSERQLAAEVSAQLLFQGADAELPFKPIVASGLNSANPHAMPGDRELQPGDLLIIDWGASYHGYIADLTRTLSMGKVDPEFEQIAKVVLEANAAARALARPGVTAGEIDLAARKLIEATGYGQYFIHRTGHGLGMEAHEAPYLYAGNPLRLEAGMTFTIEPGIYLPGRGGVRIEDDILVTPDGAESLSDLPRELNAIAIG